MDYSKPETYLSYLVVYVLVYIGLKIVLFFIYNEHSIEKVPKIINNDILENALQKLKKDYMIAFLLSKAAMWSKAPYTFLLFSTWHLFSIAEIANLYTIDALFSLISGPVLGFISDTYGRKLVSFFYPFNTIIIILLRITGNRICAYSAQVISGLSSGILATSFEAWVNFEISKVFNNPQCLQKSRKFKQSLFTEVIFYDSIISITVTIMGAFLFTYINIFASLFLSVFLSFLSSIYICLNWVENKPDEGNMYYKFIHRYHPFTSIKEGFELILNLKIFSLGVIDSLHMLGLNFFNFIWTPVLQITAQSKAIHPGVIFVLILISFLVHNKFLHIMNRLEVDYYLLSFLFSFLFVLLFGVIYFFDSWNIRLNCLLIIGGSGGLFHPVISFLKSEIIQERHRALIMNIFRIPLNLGLITILILSNFINPFTICLIVGIINVFSIIASIYLVSNKNKI